MKNEGCDARRNAAAVGEFESETDDELFNPDFPLGRDTISNGFGMQVLWHFFRRIGDTAKQNGAEAAPKDIESVRDS